MISLGVASHDWLEGDIWAWPADRGVNGRDDFRLGTHNIKPVKILNLNFSDKNGAKL